MKYRSVIFSSMKNSQTRRPSFIFKTYCYLQWRFFKNEPLWVANNLKWMENEATLLYHKQLSYNMVFITIYHKRAFANRHKYLNLVFESLNSRMKHHLHKRKMFYARFMQDWNFKIHLNCTDSEIQDLLNIEHMNCNLPSILI